MKRALIALNVLFLAFLAADVYADHRDDGPPVVIPRGEAMKTLTQLLQDVDAIANMNEDNPRKQDRRDIRERLQVMRRDIEALRIDVESAPIARGGNSYPQPVPMPNVPVALSEAEFQNVLMSYRNSYYTSQKYVVLQEVAMRNFFTVDQVIRVVNETYWASDKVKAAALLYPRVVDKNNWYKVYSALYWETDREELRRLTSGTEPGRQTR